MGASGGGIYGGVRAARIGRAFNGPDFVAGSGVEYKGTGDGHAENGVGG